MSVYKNVSYVKKRTKQTENVVIPKRKLNIFGLFFICLVTFGTVSFSALKMNIAGEVKNIIASWEPKISDLGKLKFVINQGETESDVFAHVSLMCMPFENTYIEETQDGVFKVNGLGGLVVKSCLDGKVTKVEETPKKIVHISHGKGLVSVYEDIDTLGVKVGDVVKKNSPIGVSYSSTINFKILFRNKIITGLKAQDGEMTFF